MLNAIYYWSPLAAVLSGPTFFFVLWLFLRHKELI